MRIVTLLTAGLALLGGHPVEASSVTVGALNSDLRFGLIDPYHSFRDVSVTTCVDDECSVRESYYGDWGTYLQAFGGPLVRQTLDYREGNVVRSEYEYRGGLFEMTLYLSGPRGNVEGRFVAPIVSLLIGAPNAGDGDGDSLDVTFYVLGPGRFDKSLADAFGIRQHTGGGTIESWMVLDSEMGGGDYLSLVRYAWDGGTEIAIDSTPVPEPASMLLGLVGLLALLRRTRQRPA